jgi:hypothetical protein
MQQRIVHLPRAVFIAALSIAVVTVASGVAYATIPDSGGVIHGCYKTNQGTLRVVDTEKGQACTNAENTLDWNQTGPQGPPGSPGINGDGYFSVDERCCFNLTQTGNEVGELLVTAGHYLVTTTFALENTDTEPSFVACGLFDENGEQGMNLTTLAPGQWSTMAITAPATFTTTRGMIRVWCQLGTDQHGATHALYTDISALPVARLNPPLP